MTDEGSPLHEDRLPDSPALRIDEACARFEAAWRAGQRPRIEEVVAEAAEPGRPALLRELIALEAELRRARKERPTPEEYRDRFPEQAGVVDAVFAETALGPESRRPRLNPSRVDAGRDLLFGLLALQNNFIDRSDLLAGFNSWIADRSRGLGPILLERGAVSPSRHMLLEALVAEHIRAHDDDPERSLAALSSIGSERDDLSRITNRDLQASPAQLPAGRLDDDDPNQTGSFDSAGASTSAGTRFRILRRHARGGLGEIFIARDTELNRDVALKEIQQQFADNPRFRSRFEFEAEVTGGLEHPGIVPVYGLGHTPDGRPFYAMRFIKGDSLKEAARAFRDAEKQPGRNPGQSALELRALLGRFMDVCDAVAYAHSRGVLHRDLKPGNILLGKYGETLVVDWGLAKALGTPDADSAIDRSELPLKPASASALEPTEADSALGTPAYMSPEQVDSRTGTLGVWSDVYCLGATLYYLLTGHPPCEGAQRGEIYEKVLAGKIRRPRALNPRIAPALDAICLKALARRAPDRYESAVALKADLERWLADEPVMAYPEPLAVRAARRVRRHKPWFVAAAGLLLIIPLGLAMHDWQIGQEKARTADQLGMTRTALRELFQLAGDKLAAMPNAESLRQELGELVLEDYGTLVAKFPHDPSVKLEMAHVCRVIAGIERLTGQFAESDQTYVRAIEILTGLCASEADPFEYRRWLAEAARERAELYHINGQTSRAEELVLAAIAHSEALLIRPISPAYRRVKGPALIDLAEIYILHSRHQQARAAADQAVALLEPIARGNPQIKRKPRDRWFLCVALSNRGLASQEAGDAAAAARDFSEAEALANEIIAEDDSYKDDLQFQLACIDNHRGKLAAQTHSSLAEAESALERALPRLTKLAEENKLMPHYREELAVTLSRRAKVRLAQQRLVDAQDDCEAAISLLEGLIREQGRRGTPRNPQYFSLMGQTSVLAGRILTALKHHQEGRILRDKGIENLHLACQIDPGRAKDRETLEQIEAESRLDSGGKSQNAEKP
jgi:eukaryotic-like serine/threonine-protein kinase